MSERVEAPPERVADPAATALEMGQVTSQFGQLVIAQFVASGAGLMLNVILASALGAAGFGTYSLFIAFASAAAVTLVWAPSAIVVFGQEERQRRGSTRRTMTAVGLLALGGAAISLAGIALAAPRIDRSFPPIAGLEGLLAAHLLVTSAAGMLLGVLQARREMRSYAVQVGLVPVMALTFVVSGLVLAGASAPHAIALLIAGVAAAVAIGARRFLSRLPSPAIDLSHLRSVTRYAVGWVAGATQAYVVSYLDIVVLGLILAPGQLGAYAFAARVYQQLLLFVGLAGTVALPVVNLQRSEGRDDLVREYLDRRVPQLLALVGLGLVVIGAAAGIVLPAVFDGEYVHARAPFGVLLVALLFGAWRRLISPVLTAYRLLWGMNAAAAAAAIVFIVVVSYAAPHWGGVGAAVAVAIAAAVDVAVALRVLGTRLAPTRPIRSAVFACAGIPAVLASTTLWTGTVDGALTITIAFLGYAALIRWLRAITRRDLNDVAASPLPRVVKGLVRVGLGPLSAS